MKPQPKKKPKSPLDLALRSVDNAINRTKSAFSFQNARTYGKMLESYGYPHSWLPYIYTTDELDRPITYPEINTFAEHIRLRTLNDYTQWPANENEPYYGEYPGIEFTTKATTKVEPERVPEIEVELVQDEIYDPKPPKQNATLLPKQAETARLLLKDLYGGMRGQLLQAKTGCGKTYMIGSVLRNLIDAEFFKDKTMSPWPIVYITKASIVTQTYRVLAEEFGLRIGRDVQLLNIEQLRSQFGSIYLEKKLHIIDGREYVKWEWRPIIHPCLFVLDECQQVKNEDSEQSQIMQAANEIEATFGASVYFIYMSATPFTRVAEAKCFAVATQVLHNTGAVRGIPLSNKDWPTFSSSIAYPADPIEHSPAAIDRLMDVLDPYVKRVKNIRSKFHPRNSVEIIQFKNQAERDEYDSYYQRYQARKALIEGTDVLTRSQSHFALLAQFNIFRKGAETIRAEWFADFMHEAYTEGRVPIVVVSFKEVILKTSRILFEKHGWTRNDLSLVWGGSVKAKQDAKKQAAREIMSSDELLRAFKMAGISLEALGLDYDEDELREKTQEDIEWEKAHDMGAQDPRKRQREIDKLQKGKARGAILTYKSGGVGLSVHHDREYTGPRDVVLAPVYSVMELVQGLGRAHRINSLSDTRQRVVFYDGTIERDVAIRVSLKLKCLSKVVRQRESWEDIIIGKSKQLEEPAIDLDAVDEELEDVYIEDEEDEQSDNNT
jgi:hypothetical protein